MNRHPLVRTELSDGLVGLVRPRAPAVRRGNDAGIATASQVVVTPYSTSKGAAACPEGELRGADNALPTLIEKGSQPFRRAEPRTAAMSSMAPDEATSSSSVKSIDMLKRKRGDDTTYGKKSRRREQCRANQTRYRNKQHNALVQLENDVEQLRQEVKSLKHRYKDLSSRERSSHSPWSIVAEVFHLLESSFRSPWRMASAREMMINPETQRTLAVLERSFALDAAMGDLRGVKALLDQLQLYLQCFGGSQLRLKRIETMSVGVMAARAEMSVALTESTLKHVFPRLGERHGVDDGPYKQLLGQQFECDCSMIFHFDEVRERVVRLETIVDTMKPLFRLVGNPENVLDIVENAPISHECTIDNLTD
ncbi:unnamed protein product [Phytophthora fragariaefolia]|uniref:Unnamed protein product n=1 Tax=Phytophthora fragariaefolia TaxID=1490495 RepID=A0A9W6UAM2_9STRA|nr:unnamed protein product [Phytophthora fragariaefolia]